MLARRARTFMGGVLVVALLLASIEAAVQLWHRLVRGAWYSPGATAAQFSGRLPLRTAGRGTPAGEFFTHVVHPYLGFVSDGARRTGDDTRLRLGWREAGRTLSRISPGHQVELRARGDGLEIVSTGEDAFVFIQTPPLAADRRHILSVELTAEQPAYLQLFFRPVDRPGFDEQASTTLFIPKGTSAVSFRFEAAAAIDRLRLDFGNAPGRYVVTSMAYSFVPKVAREDRLHAIATFGFTGNEGALPFVSDPARVRILVTGGSFAEGVSSKEFLERAFNRRAAARGKKEVSIFSAALEGYKQPQQALTLAFFLAVGTKFDIVINIDGFNEVVLPYQDNYLVKEYPFFPRSWHWRIGGKGLDAKTAGELLYLNEARERMIASLSSNVLYRSAAAGLVGEWRLGDVTRRIVDLGRRIDTDALTFEQSGPFVGGLGMEEVVGQSVEVWSRSSLLMKSLADGHRIEYYHVLQPNQYAPHSKPLTREERGWHVKPEEPVGRIATLGYRLLIERGRTLVKSVPTYIDATGLFAEERRTVYADNCCHLNRLGYELVADFIAREVTARSAAFGP
jgi:hypothetical protein